jgi:hypothetical protein
VERTWLREGAAAVLVLGERAMARDRSDRDPTRDHHRRADPDRQRTDRADRDRQGAERQPAAVRSSPERT